MRARSLLADQMKVQTGTTNSPEGCIWGYLRPNGDVGARNHLLILNATGLTEPVARRVAQALPSSILVSSPFGMGVVGRDAEITERCLAGLATNPNCGAVLLISADRSRLERLSERLKEANKPFAAFALDNAGHDALELTVQALRGGAELRKIISRESRSEQPVKTLCVAMECGLSDPTSGIVANPLIGLIADKIVASGGTVIVGETLEWLGVESRLADRGITAKVSEEIRNAVLRREALAVSAGIDLIGVNPNRRNIEAGLTTIEEKASGSTVKSGTAPIMGVLDYAEHPPHPGLWLMDAASYTPESLTGFAAAGAQVMLFSTGTGNSYTSAICPTLKISANEQTVAKLPLQIDFDASACLTDGNLEQCAETLFAELLATFGGTLTWGEAVGEGGEVISRYGEAL